MEGICLCTIVSYRGFDGQKCFLFVKQSLGRKRPARWIYVDAGALDSSTHEGDSFGSMIDAIKYGGVRCTIVKNGLRPKSPTS